MPLQTHLLSQAANQARGLAIDAIHACSSGHLGLPLGCADMGAVLFGDALSHHPDQPRWLNRDRFILSAGHGRMFRVRMKMRPNRRWSRLRLRTAAWPCGRSRASRIS